MSTNKLDQKLSELGALDDEQFNALLISRTKSFFDRYGKVIFLGIAVGLGALFYVNYSSSRENSLNQAYTEEVAAKIEAVQELISEESFAKLPSNLSLKEQDVLSRIVNKSYVVNSPVATENYEFEESYNLGAITTADDLMEQLAFSLDYIYLLNLNIERKTQGAEELVRLTKLALANLGTINKVVITKLDRELKAYLELTSVMGVEPVAEVKKLAATISTSESKE